MKSKAPHRPVISALSPRVPAKWRWHLRALLLLHARLSRQTHAHLLAAESVAPTDTDAGAQANDERYFDSLLTAWRHEEGLLAEVEAALERLRRGTYGRCEASGQPIPAARLRAVPWARFRREFAAAKPAVDPFRGPAPAGGA